MSSIAELATVCMTAQAQARALAIRLDRRPLDRDVLDELGEFLEHDAPRALAAHDKLLAWPVGALEAEFQQALDRIKAS